MASRDVPSPSPSSSAFPLGLRSRRGSIASVSSRSHVDKEALSQALDDIHQSASRTASYTAFNELGPPPTSTDDRHASTQGVQHGLGNIYARFRSSIQASRDRPDSSGSRPGSRHTSRADPPSGVLRPSPAHRRLDSRSDGSTSRVQPSPQLDRPFQPPDPYTQRSFTPGPSSSRHSGRLSQQGLSGQTSSAATQSSLEMPALSTEAEMQERSGTPSSGSRRSTIKSISRDSPRGSRDLGRATESPPKQGVSQASIHPQQRRDSNSIRNGVSSVSLQRSTPSTRRSSAEASLASLNTSQPGPTPQLIKQKSVNATNPIEGDPSHIQSFPKIVRTTTATASTASYGSVSQSPTISSPHPARTQSPMRPPDPKRTQSQSSVVIHEMRRKVLSRDFWMKDENAKACFKCGDSFSTFRRKHHCRTCGQIYDSKCTVLTSGKPFGQASKVRVCKTCEAIINGDDSSDYTDDDTASINQVKQLRFSEAPQQIPPSSPSSGAAVSALRRINDPRARPGSSEALPILARPSSSRSLKSLSSRPRSSGHRHRMSRHQGSRGFALPTDYHIPFQSGGAASSAPLRNGSATNLHHDSIVDPELAPFMSDEGSSDEEPSSIAANLHASVQDHSMAGLHSLSGASRKTKHKATRSNAEHSQAKKDSDAISIASSRVGQVRRHLGMRSLSTSSFSAMHASPRVIRSQNLHADYGSPVVMLRRPSIPASEYKVDHTRKESHSPGTPQALPSPRAENPEAPRTIQLDNAALAHVKRLLRQFLDDNHISNGQKWERALLPLYLRCAEDLDLDIVAGDSFDIRNYVKIKKAPGGLPRESKYVSGVVFTKNLALKGMPRNIKDARILLLSFPITYDRAEPHFMTLDPVISQEKEYLRNLVNRIKHLQPSLVLVQKQVAGLALQYLQEANIAVATNVKESVLLAVSRCAQTRIVSSVDRLTMNPSNLGSCANFEVRTFLHNGVKKSYMLVKGCQPDLGCTILLRGAGRRTLRKLKYATEFLCYMVWNLKLEASLMRDEFASMPEAESAQLTENEATQNKALPSDGFCEKLVKSLRRRVLSVSPYVRLDEPYLLLRGLDQEQQLRTIRELLESSARKQEQIDPSDAQHFELIKPGMLYGAVERESPQIQEALRAIHEAEYDRANHLYHGLRRRWENYAAEAIAPFDPVSHQHFLTLVSTISRPSGHACDGPEVVALEYYQDRDLSNEFDIDYPLGEFIEETCSRAHLDCLYSRCDKPMVDHQSVYVHGEGQVTISIQAHKCMFPGMEQTILMWSTCRRCDAETPVVPMSPNTWKYSLGKYLELTFWSLPIRDKTGTCPHDIHKDHQRFFGFKDVAVCVQYDSINLVEVQVPRSRVTWKVDKDLSHKNDEYLRIEDRVGKYLASVKARIRSIKLENVEVDKLEACKQEIGRMLKRIGDDQQYTQKMLQERYMTSKHYEITPLNRVVRAMQAKVGEWDNAFADFERTYFPTERDIRKLANEYMKELLLKEKRVDEDSGEAIDLEDPKELASIPDEKAALNVVDDLALGHRTEQTEPQRDIMSDQVTPPDVALSQARSDHDAVERLDLAVPKGSPSMSPSKRAGVALSPSPPKEAAEGQVPVRENQESLGSRNELIDTAKASATEPVSIETSMQRRVSSQGQAVSPPLFRSQTSPTTVGHHTSNTPNALEAMVPQSSVTPKVSEQLPKAPLRGAATNFGLNKKDAGSRLGMNTLKTGKAAMQSMIPRSKAKVSTLAKHFEQISREFEKVRAQERLQRAARNRQSRVYPTASYKPVIEVFRDVNETIRDPARREATEKPMSGEERHGKNTQSVTPETQSPVNETSTSSPEASMRESTEMLTESSQTLSQDEKPTEADSTELPPPPLSSSDGALAGTPEKTEQDDQSVSEMQRDTQTDLSKQEKSYLFNVLKTFWYERSASGWTPLEYLINPMDHMFEDSDIIVREDEPTSLIALALASKDYSEKLRTFRDGDSKSSSLVDALTDEELSRTRPSDAAVEKTLLGRAATHLSYYFQDEGTELRVKIFFAESFDAIRRKCGIADRFVETMSRCLKYDSKGGKTRSLFLKTLDERFIVKSLSDIEFQAFTNFAPDYFDYLSKCLFHNLPSCLAKIVGFYQVIMKNPVTKTDFAQYLLVMENVFYEGPSSRTFDLKGSMRNRRVKSTGESSEVLLDENLLDYISDSPIYMRGHSERLLESCINNDTLFCAKQNVMDYSLIAGMYDERGELVVGIIDYIRTYTWDKKLESWIKDRGRHKATVRSPKEYRNRFKASIPKYFPNAPSMWQVPYAGSKPSNRFIAWDDEIVEESETEGEEDVSHSVTEGTEAEENTAS